MSTTEVDVDPVHGRVGDTYMDRLINATHGRSPKILKFSVDETITSKRYEDRSKREN
jgi:hypothetical protein